MNCLLVSGDPAIGAKSTAYPIWFLYLFQIKLYTKDKTEACLAKYPVDILPKELEGNPKLILQEMTGKGKYW